MILLLLGLAVAEVPIGPESPPWCTVPGRLGEGDRRWCAVAPPECPGFVEACKALEARDVEQRGCAGESERKGKPADAKPATKTPGRASPSLPALAPAAWEGGLSGCGWGFLGVVLVLVVFALLRRVDGGADAEAEAEPAAPAAAGGAGPPIVPEGGDWLHAARAAAAAGRFAEALVLARTAAVASLEARGRLDPDPGRTDREVVRSLGADPATRDELRVVVGALERVRYAGGEVDRGTVDRALGAAAAIVARVGAAVVVLLCGAVLASPSAGASANDRELLRGFLQANGLSTFEADHLDPDAGVQLWFPGAAWTPEEIALAVDAAQRGATVLVVGSSVVSGMDGVGLHAPVPCVGAVKPVEGLGGQTGWPMLRLPDPAGTCARPQGGVSLLFDEAGGSAGTEFSIGAGYLVVISATSLFEDASLLHPQNRRAVLALLALKEGSAVTIVTPHLVPPTAAQSILRAGFALPFVQLALIWALWAWSGGRAFAPRRPWVEATRRDFREHLVAVSRFYRASGSSEAGFIAVSRRALARLERLTGERGEALAPAVARLTGASPDFVDRLLRRAREAVERPGADTSEHLYLVEALWKLVQQTHGASSPDSRRPSRP
jgi:hypothetical protein